MRHTAILLIPLCLGTPAALAQTAPLGLESFAAAELAPHWTVDTSREAEAAIDAERQVLVLTGPDNAYCHIETQLPAEVEYLQVDLCNVNDISASWSPSVILYWDERNYTRLMVSLTYSLRVDTVVDGEASSVTGPVTVRAGVWHRVAADLAAEQVVWKCAVEGEDLKEVCALPRAESRRGAPRLILGKGYMPPGGGNPDFDNDYGRNTKRVRVEYDNLVLGAAAPHSEALARSSALRGVAGEVDTAELQVAFWPQITRPDTEGEIILVPDLYQRLALVYCNYDERHSAPALRFELEAPESLGIGDIAFGPHRLEIERTVEEGTATYVVTPAEGFTLPASFAGVPQGEQAGRGWFKWPTSRQTPPLLVHCEPTGDAEGGLLRARVVCATGAGPWREMKIGVTAPLPALRQTSDRDLGISLWDGRPQPGGADPHGALDRWMQTLSRVGVKRIHCGGEAPVVRAARAHGIEPFLMSWWHYSDQCPPSFSPTDEERASKARRPGADFCPVVIAEGAGTYGQFLDGVTEKMRQSDCTGFMLDYECAMPLCTCDRCRQAFSEYTELPDVSWPSDVEKGGRYTEQWISFRCMQGAQYVKVIRDAARRARPDCPMQAWIAGYDYNGTIHSATIDVSVASLYMTEPEVPHYTLPADYSDMWTADAGIGSVEAGIQTVQDSLNVVDRPIIFCSSIIYPLGSDTIWSDPQMLDAQIQTIIAQGARGLSFWGGHTDGALDGRYLHKLVKWQGLLTAAGSFLWEGRRRDALARVGDPDDKLLRRIVWVQGDSALLALVNLSQEERTTTARVEGFGTEAAELVSGERVDLSQPVAVKALDGRFVVVGR